MRRRSAAFWLWWAGGILAAGGVGVAVASVLRDSSRVDDFARVPAGCTSTITVAADGDYYFYSETMAEVPDVGSCSNDGRTVELDDTPDVDLEITDASGSFVDLFPAGDAAYSLPEHEGRSVARAALRAGETYSVTVTSDVDEAVVAIGPRLVPEEQALLIVGAVIVLAAIVVLVVAFVLTMRGRRRRRTSLPPFPGGWPPQNPTEVTTTDGTTTDGTTWAPPTVDDRAG